MFLDDQLIEICLNAEIDQPGSVQQTYNKLIDVCQDYYKNQIRIGMTKKEVKIIIDRTFKLWDSFVRTAVEHDNNQVVIIGTLCQAYTFKNAFMNDLKLAAFYNSI